MGPNVSWKAGGHSTKIRLWAKVLGLLLLGYLTMTRSFAYLGIPSLKLFIGEVILGIFLLTQPRAAFGQWSMALAHPTPLSTVAWGLFLFLGYGIFELLRGIGLNHPPLVALQNLVFNYYPLYFFLGLWFGRQYLHYLPKMVRLIAWWNGLYGLAYILALSRLPWKMPGNPEIPIFGQPGGSAVALLGLLIFEPKLMRVWPLLLLNGLVMLGVQVRAEWLGFIVTFAFWGWLTKRPGRVVLGVITVSLLLSLMYVVDVDLPSPSGRGGRISVQEIVGRALAPLNPSIAEQYSEHAESYAGTVSWRTEWWRAIWAAVFENPTTALIGLGYGFPLGDLVPYLHGSVIRTPHNVFFYALGYGGCLGVVVFFGFQMALAHILLRAYQLTGQPFGLCYWMMTLTGAFFGNYLETPFGAIPFYLILGLAAAPVGSVYDQVARLRSPLYAGATGQQVREAFWSHAGASMDAVGGCRLHAPQVLGGREV
jgi:O-antigen ligase/polysaccharide polymerase Wzy-like membrane protein